MSHVLLKCPGCLSKLRLRSTARDEIECPRCGEQIRLSEQVLAAAPPSSTAPPPGQPVVPTSSPVDDSEDDFVDDFIDEDALRAKRESIIVLGVIGMAMVAALIAFPGAIYYLLNDDEPVASRVDDTGDSTTSESLSPSADTGRQTSATAEVSSNAAPASDAPPAESGATAAPTPASSDLTEDRVVAAVPDSPSSVGSGNDQDPSPRDPSGNAPPSTSTDSDPSVGVPPAPTVPTTPAVAAPPNPPRGQRALRYQWQKGDTHVYQLTISADLGSGKHSISGSCVYNVKSDAAEPDDVHEGSGSGFVVSADGIIATCAHVVDGARSIEVTLGDQTYPATVIVSKRKLDLALIQIEAQGLPVARLGNSDEVQLAENVRAFGFPLSTMLGTGIKVATGAVAGIVMHPERGKQIQTDAPINAGNSGGPIVNDSGHVIGIASSKISSSAASSVGFAVPVNKLKSLMRDQNLTPPLAGNSQRQNGPEIAARVTPTVAFIKVSGVSAGQVYDVDYNASFTQSTMQSARPFGFPGFPVMPSSNHDRGKMKVTEFGEIVEFDGEESLPFVLGPIGQFFVQPLDPDGDPTWTEQATTSLHLVKRAPRDPISQMRSRFGGRGRFGPGGPFGPQDQQEDETLRVIPAQESSSYRLGPELNGRVTIHRDYEFVTTDRAQKPFLKVTGSGDVVFDLKQGMPVSLQYEATLVQNSDDGTVQRIPLTVSYTLRDPEDIKRERAEAQRRQEEVRQQQEQERTEPNPDLVRQLLTDLRAAEGSLRGLSTLKRLASVAVVEELRDEVLQVAANHRDNSNTSIQGAAAEVFCHWCQPDQTEELWAIVSNNHATYFSARKAALRRLIRIGGEENYARAIAMMSNLSLRHEIRNLLIAEGSVVEAAVLDAVAGGQDQAIRRDLLDVLQKVGTKKSVPLLESLVAEGQSLLKYSAQRALDAVRGRL